MANYYVRKSGSDSNSGRSPSNAWLTWGKAFGTTGISSNDVLYVGAGTYREVVTASLTNPTAETRIVGDYTGANTGDAGDVVLTAYVTDDKTLPVSATTLTLSNKNFLTFENFIIVGGLNASGVQCVTSSLSKELKFRRCVFLPGTSNTSSSRRVQITVPADVVSNILFDQCITWGSGNSGSTAAIAISFTNSAIADYNSGMIIKNCLCIGDSFLFFGTTGANSFPGGGARVDRCSVIGGSGRDSIKSSSTSTIYPVEIYDCYLQGALSASVAGQIIEDFNLIYASIPRSNVSIGTNSIAGGGSYAHLIHLNHALAVGSLLKPLGTPMVGSPLLGFGNRIFSPDVDLLNRPVPAGGSSYFKGVGCFELHDTAVQEASVVYSGFASAKLAGPGDHDFQLPVKAGNVSISLKARYDSSYGAVTKPQVQILANEALGVVAQTVTMTQGNDVWESLNFATFQPTAPGFITLRLLNRSGSGVGSAFFDDLRVV